METNAQFTTYLSAKMASLWADCPCYIFNTEMIKHMLPLQMQKLRGQELNITQHEALRLHQAPYFSSTDTILLFFNRTKIVPTLSYNTHAAH